MVPRYFTHAQAEALLPRAGAWLELALRAKAGLAEASQHLRDAKLRIAQSGGAHVNIRQFTALQDRRESHAAQLRDALESLQAEGCLVKDLDLGLLDFPTLYHHREVYLCWRRGEDRIRFWHGTDEGFAGRKEIDEAFLAAHRGEQPHT